MTAAVDPGSAPGAPPPPADGHFQLHVDVPADRGASLRAVVQETTDATGYVLSRTEIVGLLIDMVAEDPTVAAKLRERAHERVAQAEQQRSERVRRAHRSRNPGRDALKKASKDGLDRTLS